MQLLRASSFTASNGGGASATNSFSRSNSSNPASAFMGDRFIPFRGASSDNFYLEEFMLNNHDPLSFAS